MKFEIPKRNLREEKDERVEDIEQAHYMGLIENSYRHEADAYAHYLEHPESYVGNEHSHFRDKEEGGLTPEDIIKTGQIRTESGGKLYNYWREIEDLQKENKKWELLKLSVKHGFKFAGFFISETFEGMKNFSEFVFSSEKREQVKKELKHSIGIEKADPQEVRKWTMDELEKEKRDDFSKNFIKFFGATSALFGKFKYGPTTDAEGWNEICGYLGKESQRYYAPKKEETGEKEVYKITQAKYSNFGSDFVGYIFNTEADYYDDFLQGKSFFGGSIKKHFESLKEKGIDPEMIKKDGKHWKKVMADLQVWNERLKKVDDEQLENELKENLRRFNNIIFGFKKYKRGEENKYMQDYIVSMYKFFKTCYAQARKKSKERNRAPEFAFGTTV